MEESNCGRAFDYGDNQEITQFLEKKLKFSLPFSEGLVLSHINPMFDTLQPEYLKVNFNNMLFSALMAVKKSLSFPFPSNIL